LDVEALLKLSEKHHLVSAVAGVLGSVEHKAVDHQISATLITGILLEHFARLEESYLTLLVVRVHKHDIHVHLVL
jgi:hypothetical protein